MKKRLGRILTDLPKWGKDGMGNEGTIKWKDCIGMDIEIEYKNNTYSIKILDYDGKNLSVKYNDYEIYYISTGSFTCGNYGGLLRLKTSEYKYQVGDVINHKNSDMVILNKIRVKHGTDKHEKGYEIQCKTCGDISSKSEIHLKNGHGCGICSNQKIEKDINSIHATDPWIEEHLVDKEDAYKYTCGSTTSKIWFKCLNCGYIKKMTPYDFYKYGIGCKRCGDGVSYPSKIMFNVLVQLDIAFIAEKSDFYWLENYNYRYDFYLPDSNILIEVDGLQHKKESTFTTITLEEQQRIDKEKNNLAKENGFLMIRIDCAKSELDFIRNNILKSELANRFDLSKIYWLNCHKYAVSSRVREACDLWNSGIHSTQKIADIMKIKTFGCICKYLKQGAMLGWCNYDSRDVMNKIGSKNGRNNGLKCSKKVICLETGQIFNSTKECSRMSEEYLGVFIYQGNISASCRLGRKRQGYHFKYITDLTPEEKLKYNVETC